MCVISEGRLRSWSLYALLQTPGVADASGGGTGSFLGLIAQSSLPSKIVLLILVVFSVLSWAVILRKLQQFRSVTSQTSSFLDVFRRSSKFSEVQSVCKSENLLLRAGRPPPSSPR